MEVLFREILDGCNEKIREKIDNVFIATYFDDRIHAQINEYPGRYDGSIVFFNYGLTSSIIEYAILFTYLSEYIFLSNNKKKKAKVIILNKFNELAHAQKEWRKNGMCDLKLMPSSFYDLPREIAHKHVAPYAEATKFVLCHEIAHSLLGHMYKKDSFFMDYFGITFSDVLSSPKDHQHEFNADIFSLLISAKAFKENSLKIGNNFKFKIEQLVGSLLVFTILGQQTEDTSSSSLSHPSIVNRFGIMINTLRMLMRPDFFQALAGLIFEFQGLLYRTQGVGLGKHLPSSYGRLNF